jgi:hypothetical protein
MPIYSMRDIETQEEFEVNIKYSELKEYLESNPNLTQVFTKFPATGDSIRLGVRRPDDNFRDVLKKAKSAHIKNTINDF